ncbi:hypothetical protein LUW76_45965 [Actinomadura madurae]|uniref:hypothetical protein n=1 Tax=Actinomadura madurae TaxID=1993 RepID=UPI0020262007|nr:hypothetical protein [Actinomadura madurae]URN01073.1 hypothetical protein LUW76_45965 [Actinomadura madurae]
MSVVGSAVLRGGLVLGVAASGFALAVAGYLWWNTTAAALIVVIGTISAVVALGWLYRTRRPLRFSGVPLTFGVLSLLAVYIVGVVAARDIAMTLVGVDAEAVVERTWTTQSRGSESHHCTLRRTDGAPIPRQLATNCEGYGRGDIMPVVLDPRERFAPVGGPKSDLPAVGESQAVAAAALGLLVSIAIGSVPAQPSRTRPSRRSRV